MIASWAWGLWLAVSWTWCIALFLPVILAADSGPGSWAIMFVCNVAGAAAMPFVFRTTATSLDFIRRNLLACRVFSWVTLVCQSWFIGWASSRLSWSAPAAIGLIALLAGAGRGRPVWIGASVVCWVSTIAAGLVDLAKAPSGHLSSLLAEELSWHPAALYALPLVFTGFAASPWLDLTFHQALRASRQPRRAFAIAFPVLFGTMLVVSLVWRDDLASLMLHPSGHAAAWLVPALVAIILQLGFTAVLHARHLPRPWLAFLVAGAVVLLARAAGDTPMPTGRSLNELLYRTSLGFYGVLVPCWIWAGHNAMRASTIVLAIIAVLLSAVPMLVDVSYRPLYPAVLAVIVLTRFVPRRTAQVDQVRVEPHAPDEFAATPRVPASPRNISRPRFRP